MKIVWIGIIFLVCTFETTAQIESTYTNNLSKERLFFSFSVGPRIQQTPLKTIHTFLLSKTDINSIIRQFEGNHRIENPVIFIGYQAKLSYTQQVGLNHSVLLDISFGNNKAYFGGYAMGWEIPLIQKKTSLHMLPNFAFLLGYTQHYIGALSVFDVNDFGGNIIQISNTQFFSDRITMHLTQDEVAYIYGPELAFSIFSDVSNVSFLFSGAYYFNSAPGDAAVIFTGNNLANGFEKSATLNVANPLLNVYYNENILIEKNPFNYGGVRCNFSIVFDF